MLKDWDKAHKRIFIVMSILGTVLWLIFGFFLVKKASASVSNGDYIYIDNTAIIQSGADYTRNDPYAYKDFTVSESCLNPYLLVIATTWNSDDIVSISYNNIALTRLLKRDYAGGSTDGYIYGLASPDAGTNQLMFTFSSVGERPIAIMSLCNVDPANPLGTDFLIGDSGFKYTYNSGTVANYENENSFLLSLMFSANNDILSANNHTDFLATNNWNGGKIFAAYSDDVSNPPSQFSWSFDSGSMYGASLVYGVFNYLSSIPGFSIISPEMNEIKIKESWITVSGNCPTNGSKRIALTNDCSDFSNLDYTVDCVDNQFSADFYYSGLSDWVVAVELDSVATDCVNYDDLMDGVEISGIEVIEGYPDEWYFNYDYYDDYDIEIVSPVFDMPALTLPLGSLATDLTFSFTYPHPLSPFLVFNIKQYDENGALLNDAYHTKALYEMADTSNYTVNLTAGESPLHYVVQLLNSGELVRQYPFGIFVSDLDLIINPDEYRYLFPRLVEKLKKKVVFNYYFAFYDGFYSLFNGSIPDSSDDALDITFKSVSGDGQYNLDIPVFKGSDPTVKTFANGLRPYITAFLWLIFALYVVMRINGLFNSDE